MNPHINKKGVLGCLTTLLILMFVTTFLATSSLNPLAVYSVEGIAAKIIVSVSALFVAMGLLQLLTLVLLRWQIALVAKRPADDVNCRGCGLPLIAYMGSHGQPIVCPKCHVFWHNGPACYTKGMEQRVLLLPTTLCPNCRRDASHLEDLGSDLDDLAK